MTKSHVLEMVNGFAKSQNTNPRLSDNSKHKIFYQFVYFYLRVFFLSKTIGYRI
jgi:hypothetical protein